MTRSRYLLAALGAFVLQGATLSPATAQPSATPVQPVAWKAVETVDLAAFNKDLTAGKPTMDVVVYMPSNFDPSFNKLTLAQKRLEGQIVAGKRYRKILMHRVDGGAELAAYPPATKMNADWPFLTALRDLGRVKAEHWLKANYAAVGKRATLDLRGIFE